MPTKPQDHKPKADIPKEVTVSGVTLTIDPNIFDDLDFLDALDQISNENNGLRIAGLLRQISGEQFKEVKEALRDPETKRIPIEAASTFFTEVMKEIAPNS